MRIEVRVHPNSKKVRVVRGEVWDVYLTESPENNKANRELMKVLGRMFGCAVSIVRGLKSRRKIVELDLDEDGFSEGAEKGRD